MIALVLPAKPPRFYDQNRRLIIQQNAVQRVPTLLRLINLEPDDDALEALRGLWCKLRLGHDFYCCC